MNLIVITPTYNEAQNLPQLSERVLALPIDGIHLLIVDDNSPDGTGQIAEKLKEKEPESISVIHRKGKLGLGSAYIEGMKRALNIGANAIAQMDADLSHPENSHNFAFTRMSPSFLHPLHLLAFPPSFP